ncbi:MAG: hypothetical protein AAF432_10630, partial [Planctomycetota bacterium]
STLQTVTASLAAVESQRDALQASLDDHSERYEEMTNTLTTTQRELDDVRTSLDAQADGAAAHEAALRELESTHETAISEKDQTIATLRADLAEAQSAATDAATDANAEAEAVREERDALAQAATTASEQIAALTTTVDEQRAELDSLTEQFAEVDAERERALADTRGVVEQELADAKSAHANAIEEANRLTQEIDARCVEIQSLQSSTADAASQIEQLERQLRTAGYTASGARDQLLAFDASVTPLRDTCTELLQVRRTIESLESDWALADERMQAAQDANNEALLHEALAFRDSVARQLDEAHATTDTLTNAMTAALTDVDRTRAASDELLSAADATNLPTSKRQTWFWLLTVFIALVAAIVGVLIGQRL